MLDWYNVEEMLFRIFLMILYPFVVCDRDVCKQDVFDVRERKIGKARPETSALHFEMKKKHVSFTERDA